MSIKVSDYGHERDAASAAEVEAMLAERTLNGMNMWWVSFDERYPCVSILANESLACVHFHPHDQHPGFQAQGPASGLDEQGQTMFSISGPNEEVWMPNTSVVDFSIAVQAVRDFLRDKRMSPGIQWLEL